jgi:hypothetical protein
MWVLERLVLRIWNFGHTAEINTTASPQNMIGICMAFVFIPKYEINPSFSIFDDAIKMHWLWSVKFCDGRWVKNWTGRGVGGDRCVQLQGNVCQEILRKLKILRRPVSKRILEPWSSAVWNRSAICGCFSDTLGITESLSRSDGLIN